VSDTERALAPDHALAPGAEDGPDAHNLPRWVRGLERGSTVMLVGGVGSLLLSFFTLGVLPLAELTHEVSRSTPATYQPMNDLETIGFAVYKREGCAYCHTTFVRDTPADVQRFGPPAEAWEFQDQYPQQWGTRRIGPDLSRESGRRSADWHYAHLYNPRSTVPESIMPAYPWLFTVEPGGRVAPTEQARGVVAYLDYLGRAMAETGPQTARGQQGSSGSSDSGSSGSDSSGHEGH
jgi:hypothetical protein